MVDNVDTNRNIAWTINDVLSKAVGVHLDALRSKQHSFSRAEAHIFELWVLSFRTYVSIINDCEFYLSLVGCKTEFLLHWLFTKFMFLGADGLLTDDNSVLLLSTVLNEMHQNSLQNAIKTQSFWANFVLPSIVRTLRYERLHIRQLIDAFLETFNADFLDADSGQIEELSRTGHHKSFRL